jgi:hypothetical protein
VPNAPAQTREEWWDSDVVVTSGMRLAITHDELGEVELPGNPLRLSRTPGVFSHLPGPRHVVAADGFWCTPPESAASLPTPSTDQPDGPPLKIAPAEVREVLATGTAESSHP